jgi:hypothetical protein
MGRFVRPTLSTKFHIDFRWWLTQQRSLGAYLQDHVCAECPPEYIENARGRKIDWISLETGEVFQIDGLWDLIRTHCSQHPGFVSEQSSLVSASFRLFISNDNRPLTPVEIHHHVRKKSPETILRTVGGRQIYMGIRPVTALKVARQTASA